MCNSTQGPVHYAPRTDILCVNDYRIPLRKLCHFMSYILLILNELFITVTHDDKIECTSVSLEQIFLLDVMLNTIRSNAHTATQFCLYAEFFALFEVSLLLLGVWIVFLCLVLSFN